MVLHWPGGRAMWSMCSHFSYFSNAVCLGLCDAGECFSHIAKFYDSLGCIVVSCSSCERERNQEQPTLSSL